MAAADKYVAVVAAAVGAAQGDHLDAAGQEDLLAGREGHAVPGYCVVSAGAYCAAVVAA